MSNTTTETPKTGRKGLLLGVLAVLMVGAALLLFRMIAGDDRGGDLMTGTVSDGDLTTAADTRVFFGHQSVGMNILDGVPEVYAARDLPGPEVLETTTPPSDAKYAHAYIGENTKPDLKMADFETLLADGLGSWADVAFMKLCYVDIVAGTDVDAVFTQYQQTMTTVEAAHPGTTFLYMTVPLTTEPGWKSKIKGLVGRGSSSTADNAARERFNNLVREAYGDTGRLFDVATLQSTTPSGERVGGSVDGQAYYALYGGYAADSGHLTPEASAMVAEQLLGLIASVQR